MKGALYVADLFQSTLPRVERRLLSSRHLLTYDYFNPRSREWSDLPFPAEMLLKNISIHAPASGATLVIIANSNMTTVFQSTLPRVERRHLLTFFRLQYGYILFHLTNKYSFCF